MLRDKRGRFCKANKNNVKSTKIPFLSKNHINKKEEEWSDLGKDIEKALKELDATEPIILHVKIRNSDAIDLADSKVEEKEDRFEKCVNNASIFDRLDWDERAKFMEALCNDGKCWSGICDTMSGTCTIEHPIPLKDGSGCRIVTCNGRFTDWFFNYYDPEVFHKILGD